jgi:hypothetical protein
LLLGLTEDALERGDFKCRHTIPVQETFKEIIVKNLSIIRTDLFLAFPAWAEGRRAGRC